MKIPVLPPDVNESGSDFTVAGEHKDTIRFGLTTIKNFGEGISQSIIAERTANGPFTSLADFLCRVDARGLNRKSLEALIKSGALDSLSGDRGRGTMLAHIELLLTFHRDATAPKAQDSLFGAMAAPILHIPASNHPVSLSEQLIWEKELLGIYVSGHPLDAFADTTAKASTSIAIVRADPRPGIPFIIPVLLEEVRTLLTKKGEKMAFVRFADKTDSMEAVIFPKTFKEHGDILSPGTCLLIKATASIRNGETSLAIDKLKLLV
jgi:DNA polymerase-3 subunit alpha